VDTLTLVVGARALMTLSGIGSAGYRWAVTIDNPLVAKVIRAPAPAAPANAPRSFSRDERYEIVGLAPGETVIHFRQTRSFEPQQPPIADQDIAVRVTN